MEVEGISNADAESDHFDVFDKKFRRRAVLLDNLDKDKELKVVEQTLLPHLEALT